MLLIGLHLKTDFIGSGVIKMLNMITLLNWPESKADLSFIWNKIKLLYTGMWFDYYDTGIEAVNSLRPWDILTWLDLSNVPPQNLSLLFLLG